MKLTKMIISYLFIIYTINCLAWLNVDQMDRYAEKYAGRSNGATSGIQWDNMSKFIYDVEDNLGASYPGYIDGADCAHFVSQCLEAGGICVSEDQLGGTYNYMDFFINTDPMYDYFTNQNCSLGYIQSWWSTESIWPYIESSHPYSNNTYDWIPFYCPAGAYETKFHFVRFETEYDYDWLSITDDNYITSYSGDYGFDFWEGPFYGTYLDIEFESDYSNTDWGYQIDQYEWRTDQAVVDYFDPGDVMILGSQSNPQNHATICTATGPYFSAHNSDRHDKLYSYWYPNSKQRAEFYDMSILLTEEPNLCWDNYFLLEEPIIVTDNPADLSQHHYSDFEYGETVYIYYSFTNDGWIMIPDNFKVTIYVNDIQIATHQYDGMLANDIYVSYTYQNDDVTFLWENADATIRIELDSGSGTNYLLEQNWDEESESDNSGLLFITSTGNINSVPNVISLLKQNYPNPFNPSTTISYSLAENCYDPQIEIYNVKGQKVKSIQLEDVVGENSIVWNGKDANDKSVSSGVYFYQLINDGKTVQSCKMLMIK
jgi:hypothetical protein